MHHESLKIWQESHNASSDDCKLAIAPRGQRRFVRPATLPALLYHPSCATDALIAQDNATHIAYHHGNPSAVPIWEGRKTPASVMGTGRRVRKESLKHGDSVCLVPGEVQGNTVSQAHSQEMGQ